MEVRKALGYKDDVAFKTEHHANTMAELRKEYGRREEAPESSRRRVWGVSEGSQTARGHTKRGKGNKQTFEEALAPNPNPTAQCGLTNASVEVLTGRDWSTRSPKAPSRLPKQYVSRKGDVSEQALAIALATWETERPAAALTCPWTGAALNILQSRKGKQRKTGASTSAENAQGRTRQGAVGKSEKRYEKFEVATSREGRCH